MSEQLACTPNGTSLSFRGHQNNAVLQVEMSGNVGMAKLINLGAGMHLAKGERCEGVKKRLYQETRHSSEFLCHYHDNRERFEIRSKQ